MASLVVGVMFSVVPSVVPSVGLSVVVNVVENFIVCVMHSASLALLRFILNRVEVVAMAFVSNKV